MIAIPIHVYHFTQSLEEGACIFIVQNIRY